MKFAIALALLQVSLWLLAQLTPGNQFGYQRVALRTPRNPLFPVLIR